MINLLTEHDFSGKRVRSVTSNGQTWVVLTDALQAMDYRVKASHVAKLMRNEDRTLCDIGSKSSLVNCISKSGLYLLTRFCNRKIAAHFYDWAEQEIFRKKTDCTQGKGKERTV